MIILNKTITIDISIKDEWISWIKEKYIPIHTETGLCKCILLEIDVQLEHDDRLNGKSYALQLSFNSTEQFDIFKDKFESKLNKLQALKFGHKYVAFSTILKSV